MANKNERPLWEFFENYMIEYGQAFDNYDIEAILKHYHTPSFVFKAGKLIANINEDTQRRYFLDLLKTNRESGYDKVYIESFDVQMFGHDSALITINWVFRRENGETVFDFWDSYLLGHIDGQWKILGDTVYDR